MQCVRDQMGPYMAAIPDAKITNAGNSFFLLMIQSRNTNPISHLTYNQIYSKEQLPGHEGKPAAALFCLSQVGPCVCELTQCVLVCYKQIVECYTSTQY